MAKHSLEFRWDRWWEAHPKTKGAVILLFAALVLGMIGVVTLGKKQEGDCDTVCKAKGYDHWQIKGAHVHRHCLCYKGGTKVDM